MYYWWLISDLTTREGGRCLTKVNFEKQRTIPINRHILIYNLKYYLEKTLLDIIGQEENAEENMNSETNEE